MSLISADEHRYIACAIKVFTWHLRLALRVEQWRVQVFASSV